MKKWFKDLLTELVNKAGHLTERILEIIVAELDNDDIAYLETHEEQIDYLKEVLNDTMTKCKICGKLQTSQNFDKRDYGTKLENTCLDCQDMMFDEVGDVMFDEEGDE